MEDSQGQVSRKVRRQSRVSQELFAELPSVRVPQASTTQLSSISQENEGLFNDQRQATRSHSYSQYQEMKLSFSNEKPISTNAIVVDRNPIELPCKKISDGDMKTLSMEKPSRETKELILEGSNDLSQEELLRQEGRQPGVSQVLVTKIPSVGVEHQSYTYSKRNLYRKTFLLLESK